MKIITKSRSENQEVLMAVSANGSAIDFVSIDYNTKCYRLGIHLDGIKPEMSDNNNAPLLDENWRMELRKNAESALKNYINKKNGEQQ